MPNIQGQTTFRVMFYNVENLFDTTDNPHTSDEEFTPTGSRHWTPKRYYHKTLQIARVITAAGEWSTPALIGLCEVENDSALCHLLKFLFFYRLKNLFLHVFHGLHFQNLFL